VSRISQSQLESYLWGAAEHLRGSIDAGDYKQFIFPLLFLKRLCDVHDEETTQALRASGGDAEFASFAENHRFQIPAEAHWKEIRKETRNVGQAIQRAMRAIESANKDKLFGIFGDAQWTNKDRLSDETMRELVEHFSSLELTITNLPEDELGNGYEFLIKKFADDSGHTAAEFYTNRTVVHLMTEMLDVQPGESVYDPTCGSGGMLMSCVAHLRKQGKEWRNVRLFGQERNLMTSSIARMNCFLHGIEDFRIERGDTLAEPKLVEGDKLMQFDVVLANPPYSIKQWDREAFRSDPWGRNLFGVPPQGRADYAFQQHINKSLKAKTGRCAVLWPHGVLFRQEEEDIRSKLIEADLIECVIGLGPNLFYNSPMEACILVCRTQKSKIRKGKVLFINAVNEVTRERAQSFLTEEHQSRILQAYQSDTDIPGLSRHVTTSEIRSKNGSLSIPLYFGSTDVVQDEAAKTKSTLDATLSDFLKCSEELRCEIGKILSGLPQRSTTLNVKEEKPLCELITTRAGWTRVRFGDVVENCSDTGKGKGSAPGRYIGLEHIEPGSLHIRSFGDTPDGTTFTKTCKPGQVLFGKRRAYQRKVAVASFDALVSGDIYVLEPKNPSLLPELLPFICMSDRFFEHAVGTSAGSLSPRTNWSSLASYEFDLPPLDQQSRIAGILWAFDNSATQLGLMAKCLEQATARQAEQLLVGNNKRGRKKQTPIGDLPEEWQVSRLEDCCPVITVGIASSATHAYAKEGTPLIRNTDIKNGYIDQTALLRVNDAYDLKYASKKLRTGDVLTVRTGNPGVSAVVPAELDRAQSFTTLITRTNPEILDPGYLVLWLNSGHGGKFVRRGKAGGAQQNLNAGALSKMVLPTPPLGAQREIIEEVNALYKIINGMNSHALMIDRLFRALISTSFQ
jgi:type I restriction enzyme M protein